MSALVNAAVSEDTLVGACPDYPGAVESLVGVLRYQLERMPERVVCSRIARRRNGFTSEPLTVEALARRASMAAAVLRAAGVSRGDRVILSLSNPHDFILAFFGTLLAGASAVPLPTVAEAGAPRSFAERVRAVCRDCRPAVAIVESRDRFRDTVGALPYDLAVLEAVELGFGSARIDLPEQSAAAPAFVQYTSGSTGDPKGVVVTHGNILANCRAIRDATAYTRADRMVSWLPLHHDMGLVGGLLTSLYCAAETCLMPPLAFLARPVTWLEAITEYSGSLTVAPTFAYSLCARKIPEKQLDDIDLSSLRLAYIGAEPIDAATLNAFIERFVRYGLAPSAMYPVYGLAECTLAVSFPPPGHAVRCDTVDRRRLAVDGIAESAAGEGPDTVTFVSVGQPLPRHRVEIVDNQSGEPLGERQVGEVVVYGASVTPRYFAEGSEEVRPRLHTGDLAYAADGHLYVVDRIKDLVIVAGQNYPPSDIENAVAEIEDLRRGRIVAFSSRGSGGTEELHIVAEISTAAHLAPEPLIERVRQKIRREIGLSAATVTLVAPGSLERTSSGKIKRRACADGFRDGKLVEVRTRADVFSHRIARYRDRIRLRVGHAWRAAWDGLGSGLQRLRG